MLRLLLVQKPSFCASGFASLASLAEKDEQACAAFTHSYHVVIRAVQISSLSTAMSSLRAELQRASDQNEQFAKEKDDMVQANLRVCNM